MSFVRQQVQQLSKKKDDAAAPPTMDINSRRRMCPSLDTASYRSCENAAELATVTSAKAAISKSLNGGRQPIKQP